MKRNIYLNTIPVEEAKTKYLEIIEQLYNPCFEMISVVDALNRVTAEAVYAKFCSPLFNASAMDGIAVVSAHTKGASEAAPLTIFEGTDYKVVDTGDPIHMPYDAVVMVEDLIQQTDGTIAIISSVAPWQHVRPIGEDIVAGEMLLSAHHKLRPMDISVLLAGGILELLVLKRPTVAIFPTGTEIIEPTQTPKEGDIIETNSRMFENMITLQGGLPTRFAPIIDDYDLIKQAVSDAVERFDMVIINAGSSAGTEDFTVHVLRELGEVHVHGVAVKPGKPVILATVNGKPVIGLPGYPVSAYIGFENFVSPIMELYTEQMTTINQKVDAVITRRLVSSLKHKEYIRVKVGMVEDKLVASPLARGAGAAMSLVRADGFCVIPQNSEGVEAADTVSIELYRDLEEIKKTLVLIGSHDLLLDVMADQMPNHHKNMYLSSSHVGSMGGLMALKRKEAHLAPIHLLDEETGIYNESYLAQMFREPMALIKGVGRIQGFIVKKGNPLNIQAFEDLKKYRFVNRQRGAGTRLLLDFKLKEAGINPSQISGYEQELATHMAVAAAVGSEGADVGLGVMSAANAMGLDFIPVGVEEYDFALPLAYLEMPQVQAFIEELTSDSFKESLTKLGGYDTEHSGIIKIIGEKS